MTNDEYKIPLTKIIEEFELEKIYETTDIESVSGGVIKWQNVMFAEKALLSV